MDDLHAACSMQHPGNEDTSLIQTRTPNLLIRFFDAIRKVSTPFPAAYENTTTHATAPPGSMRAKKTLARFRNAFRICLRYPIFRCHSESFDSIPNYLRKPNDSCHRTSSLPNQTMILLSPIRLPHYMRLHAYPSVSEKQRARPI